MTQNLPAHLQNLQAPDIGASLSANLGSAMPPHVSIGGGRFTLIDAGNNEIPVPTFDPQIGVYLDACIVDVNEKMSRIYFAGSYDPNLEGTRPDCFSDNGVAPSISAASPQANSCMPDPTGVSGCKWAVWGSKINANGKGVPACSSKQKIALLIPGFQTLFLLAVPPNSHGPLREYVEKAKGSQVNIADIFTRISFMPGVQGTLLFKPSPLMYIDEATAKLRQAAYAEKKTDALVGRTDVPRPAGMIAAAPASQVSQTGQAPLLSSPNQPTSVMQAQPAVPFVPPSTPQATTAAWPVANAPTQAGPASVTASPSAQPASPSEGQTTQRRRRRTAAEMAAANGQAPAAQQPGPTPAAPQAPFPVNGQAPAPQASFGIAQPAAASAELNTMLDDFFK